jgi:cellulose synthase/poly-beta-1,6-N-acetylglucosamine synthase-like glycosyltransferase
VYDEVITAILFNRPARMEIVILNAKVSKRKQVIHAFGAVETEILVMVDDTAIWNPTFLSAILPAFGSKKVGFVGCRKWVKCFSHPRNPSPNFFAGLWDQYHQDFWNGIVSLYLVRHNFEIKVTNAADGGVFCVSGRSSLICTSVVKNAGFTKVFTDQCYAIPGLSKYGEIGPVLVDDDNFFMRWVVNHSTCNETKIQYAEEAPITTILGKLPLRFPDQCKGWSRTTFRQNTVALF